MTIAIHPQHIGDPRTSTSAVGECHDELIAREMKNEVQKGLDIC